MAAAAVVVVVVAVVVAVVVVVAAAAGVVVVVVIGLGFMFSVCNTCSVRDGYKKRAVHLAECARLGKGTHSQGTGRSLDSGAGLQQKLSQSQELERS